MLLCCVALYYSSVVLHCIIAVVVYSVSLYYSSGVYRAVFSVPPRLIQEPRDQEVTLNNRFEMECIARGVPTPIITWKLNGRPLAAPPSVNGASTVVVRHAMQEDGGEYTCVATNPANNQQVSATARVIIKGE